MSHPHFHWLFFKREGLALLGKGGVHFILLCGILLLSFLSIGFANGSLEYLKQKINDPYINWVAVEIPRAKSNLAETYAEELNQNEAWKTRYGYRQVLFHRRYPLEFWNHNSQQLDKDDGRSFELNDPLLAELLTAENHLKGEQQFRNQEDLGLIVKASFLQKKGYPLDAPYLLMATYTDSSYYDNNKLIPQHHLFPIPIRAVVQDLPGFNEFAFTHFFFRQVTIVNTQNPFNRARTEGLNFYANSEVEAEQLMTAIREYFAINDTTHQVFTNITTIHEADTEAPWQNGFLCSINIPNSPLNTNQKDSLFTRISTSPPIKAINIPIQRVYDFKSEYHQNPNPYDYISIDFASLGDVRAFRDNILQKEYDLSIDMVQLEALENYHFVSRLSLIISFSLILFSVLSICLFLTNILRAHLDKIKGNIGSFKAFGLYKNSIIRIYLLLVLAMTIAALIISYGIAWLFGKLGLVNALLQSIKDSFEINQSYFKLWDSPTWMAIVAVLMMVCVVVWWVASSILNKTPGDLVYDR